MNKKKTKKKILFYGINYFPEKVGIGKYTYEMCSWLAQNNYDIKIITSNKYFPEFKLNQNNYTLEKIKGVEVIRCPIWVPKKPNGIKRIFHLISFALTSFPPLIRNIFWKPNLLFLIAPSLIFAPSTILFKILISQKSFKTWIHIQDFEVDAAFNLGILKGNFLQSLALIIEYKLLNNFDLISTISNDMLRKAQSKLLRKEKIILLPNWIDFEKFSLKKIPDKIKNKYYYYEKLFKKKIIVMYSGSMNQKQNFDLIVDCIKYYKNNSEIMWIITGEGPSKEEFIKKVKKYKNVKIYNLQPDYFFNYWLKLADIHLLPQRKGISNSVLPSKLISILASGKPVIAFSDRDSELGNLVSKGGISIESYELNEFIKALDKLIYNKNLRDELGRNGFKLSKELFDKKLIFENLKNEIEKIIN